jgi:dTDP-4-dehydrorhamnose reductase
MRVAVIGANGQLGRECIEAFRAAGHTAEGGDLPDVDLEHEAALVEFLAAGRPDWVVNAAAFTNVDGCETDPALARRVNTDGPARLARLARDRGARLLHVSTDFVFDGAMAPPGEYSEDDETNPVNVYGRSKLDGERGVQEAGGHWAIVRTAWLYGGGGGFLAAVLRRALARGGTPVRVVTDQRGSPTRAWRLARQMVRLAEADASGLYHAAGSGSATRFEFARRFLDALSIPCVIEPATSEAFPVPARRPPNGALRNARLEAEGLSVFGDWREDVDAYASRHREEILRAAEPFNA